MSRHPLARLRLALYALLLAPLAFWAWRYELVRLPERGCSPLVGVAPGDRLVVERRARRAARPGDAVLYRLPAEPSLLLGRVLLPPSSAPAAVHAAVEAGRLWIEGELPDCPSPDSRLHGPIAPEDVVGRVVLTLPW